MKHLLKRAATACALFFAMAFAAPAFADCTTSTTPNTSGLTANAQYEAVKKVCDTLAAGLNITAWGGSSINPLDPTPVSDSVVGSAVNANFSAADSSIMQMGCIRDTGAANVTNGFSAACRIDTKANIYVAPRFEDSSTAWGPVTSTTNVTGTSAGQVAPLGLCNTTGIPTTTTNGNFGPLRRDCVSGALLTAPYAQRGDTWRYAAAGSGIANTTTAVTIKAADTTHLTCVRSLQVSWATLGAATELALRDGAGGTVMWRTTLPTAAGNMQVQMEPPVCGAAVNTLVEAVTLTAVTGGVYVSAQGYVIAP